MQAVIITPCKRGKEVDPVMAYIRKRANGMYSLAFWWQGKQFIKALGTTDEKEAERIKKDAENQLDRIRKGKSPLAARLLKDGLLP